MNEWQGYFFLSVTYPYIWWFSQYFIWTHLSITPVFLIWLLIDPSILVSGQREDGTLIPRDNYAYVFATVDAITAMMYGDLTWLYKGRDGLQISFMNFLNHFVFNVINFLLTPLLVWPMYIWTFISTFQLFVLYIYTEVISGPPGQQEVKEIDEYYYS